MKKICVVGTGYVGLVTAAGLADFGNSVIGADIDESKIEILKKGGIPIYEPGLGEVVERNVKAGRLHFTTDIDSAIRKSRVIFSAVGTPPGDGGEADLCAVWTVATAFAKNLDSYKVFINKSTVPVGTGKKTHELILKESGGKQHFDVVSNPEFLREGSAVGDFLNPDRVVVGTRSPRAREIMKDVYHALLMRTVPYVETNIESAEIIKYASNAFLATKITFINEIANLCDIVGGDVKEVARAMGMDGRISPKFLHAGPGFGGSCFPKDTMALAEIFKANGIHTRLVEATIAANEHQKQSVVNKLRSVMPILQGKTVAVLGLAFKPNTDDTRFSASKVVIPLLEAEGAHVQVFDPVASDDFRRDFPDLDYKHNVYEAVEGADAVVLMTEWNEFRSLDLKRMKSLMKSPVFVDTRNIYHPRDMKEKGFTFVCTGRTKCYG